MPPISLHGWNAHAAGPLAAGPLIGEASPEAVRIWAQARDEETLSLRIYAHEDDAAPLLTLQQTPTAEDWLCTTFQVTGLTAGGAYFYSFHSAHGETDRMPLRLGVSPDATALLIAFGSCYKEYSRDLRIFDAMARTSPDLFLMLGDTCYSDEDDRRSEATFMAAHLRNRNNDGLRRLISKVPTLGIWDDHDYGPNDSDGTYAEKARSLRCFRRMWAQDNSSPEDHPAIFSRVRCGPVDLFLLDSRSFRRKRGHVLGEVQLRWLLSELRESQAPIKLLLSGSQLLPEVAALPDWDWECFRRDGAAELEQIQRFLAEEDIQGVLALSGDPHLGQLFYSPGLLRPDGQRGPRLWELTSSPLANRPWSKPVWPADSHGEHAFDRYLLEEVAAVNFGLVDIDLARAGAEVRLALCSEEGASLFSYDIDVSTLRVGPTRRKLCLAVRDERRAYAFIDDHYVRYDLHKQAIDAGFPQKIRNGWKGVFSDRLGAGLSIDAVYFSKRGKAYFFCGNGYVRFDLQRDQVDPGFPRYIKTHWRGLWAHDLTAILPAEGDKVYFIRESECIRYDLGSDQADEGYPQLLSDEFPGLASDPNTGATGAIDAAVAWNDGGYYFVYGDQVMRYDAVTRSPSPGYPRALANDPALAWLQSLR